MAEDFNGPWYEKKFKFREGVEDGHPYMDIDDLTVTEVTRKVGESVQNYIDGVAVTGEPKLTLDLLERLHENIKARHKPDEQIFFETPYYFVPRMPASQGNYPTLDIHMPGEPMPPTPGFAQGGYVADLGREPYFTHPSEIFDPRYQHFGADIFKKLLRRPIRVKPTRAGLIRQSTVAYATVYRARPGR